MPSSRETRFLRCDAPEGEVSVPVATVHGGADGPTLVVVAGVHGSEYVGIEATKQLFRWIDADALRGTVVTVPCLNVPAFYGLAAHVNPLDGKDPGRAFPGDAAGSHTERLAELVWREVVEGADYLIDVHGGDLEEELVEYTQINLTGNPDVDAAGEALARAMDMPIFVRRPRADPPPERGGLFGMAAERGIPSVLAEAGSHGLLEYEVVAVHFRGLRNVLYHLDMLDGEPTREHPDPLLLHRFTGIAAPVDGFWQPSVVKGEIIRKGQEVGEMQDLFGERLATITADEDAAILGVMTIPPRLEGSMLMGLGTLA
jgi:hypothetical protein